MMRRSIVPAPAPAMSAASSSSGFIARKAGHSHRNASGSSCSVATQTMPAERVDVERRLGEAEILASAIRLTHAVLRAEQQDPAGDEHHRRHEDRRQREQIDEVSHGAKSVRAAAQARPPPMTRPASP